jgi:hypothetical protein
MSLLPNFKGKNLSKTFSQFDGGSASISDFSDLVKRNQPT